VGAARSPWGFKSPLRHDMTALHARPRAAAQDQPVDYRASPVSSGLRGCWLPECLKKWQSVHTTSS
jgi:hypothetical protein